MPEIRISLDEDTHKKLKELAKKDHRSLRNYVIVTLEKNISLASAPSTSAPSTSTPSAPSDRYTKFQKMAKEILGHELTNVDDYRLMSYEENRYYDRSVEEPLTEGSTIRCVYVYNLPEEKQREYLEEWKHYE